MHNFEVYFALPRALGPRVAAYAAALPGCLLERLKNVRNSAPRAYWFSSRSLWRASSRHPGEVHDREPAFLSHEAVDDWLGDELDADEMIDLLKHSSEAMADELEFFEVSRSVNRVQKSKGVQ